MYKNILLSSPSQSGRAAQSRAEQNRAVAYCQQPASTVTPGIEPHWDPWPYICSMSRLFFSFPSFVVTPLIKREGLDFFFYDFTTVY
jgi:hypothetical protein